MQNRNRPYGYRAACRRFMRYMHIAGNVLGGWMIPTYFTAMALVACGNPPRNSMQDSSYDTCDDSNNNINKSQIDDIEFLIKEMSNKTGIKDKSEDEGEELKKIKNSEEGKKAIEKLKKEVEELNDKQGIVVPNKAD